MDERIVPSGEMGFPNPEEEVNQGRVELSPDTRPRPEASPEEFQEMIDHLPTLKEILREAEAEFADLENNPDADKTAIQELRGQIDNLKEEIYNREDLIT